MLICGSCGTVLERSANTSFEQPDSFEGRSFLTDTESSNWSRVERRIADVAVALRLGDDIQQVAMRYVKALLKRPRTGRALESCVACALLLATRCDPHAPVLRLEEVAVHASCSRVLVGQRWLHMVSELESQQLLRAGVEVRLQPAQLLERYAETLRKALLTEKPVDEQAAAAAGRGGKVRSLAEQLLELAKQEWLVEGRSPASVVAAVLLVSAQAHSVRGKAATAGWVAKTLLGKSSVKSMSHRVAELKAVCLGITRSLPGRGCLSDSQLLRSLPSSLPEALAARAALLQVDVGDSDEEVDTAKAAGGQLLGEVAQPGDGALGGAGAVVGSTTRHVTTRHVATSASVALPAGPPSFVAAARRREGRIRKIAAAQRRIQLGSDATHPDGLPALSVSVGAMSEAAAATTTAATTTATTAAATTSAATNGGAAVTAGAARAAGAHTLPDGVASWLVADQPSALDKEDYQIEAALRRGVPVREVEQGYFESESGQAGSKNEQPRVSNLLSETLSDADLAPGELPQLLRGEEERKDRKRQLVLMGDDGNEESGEEEGGDAEEEEGLAREQVQRGRRRRRAGEGAREELDVQDLMSATESGHLSGMSEEGREEEWAT